MQTSTKVLIKGSIMNCGLATAIINGIIAYFSLPQVEQMTNASLSTNFVMTALGCGLICPFFGGLILKGVLAKNAQLDFGAKQQHFLARFVPDNLFPAAVVIAILTGIFLWVVPWGVLTAISCNFALSRSMWIPVLGIYSGIAASFAAYFGMLRAHFNLAK